MRASLLFDATGRYKKDVMKSNLAPGYGTAFEKDDKRNIILFISSGI